MKRPLIVLTGPTAVGKTSLSISLAKAVNGEIISADSMQVYKKMDIGSAKIRPEEMQGVKHYLVDVLEPEEEFHIVKFQQMAKEAMEEIYEKGKIPILVGGTGFYIQAVTRDIDFTEAQQENTYRAELEKLAETEGAEYLHDRLKEVDPASADTIHANNVKRVIRALEFYHQNGTPISAHNEEQKKQTSPFLLTIRWITCTIAITPKRNPAFIISTAVISKILLSKIIRQTNRFYMSRTTGKAGNHSYSIKRTHPIPIRKRMFLSE